MARKKSNGKRGSKLVMVCKVAENSITHFAHSRNYTHGNVHGRDADCTIMDYNNMNKKPRRIKFRGITLDMPHTTD